jgi:hypothetical protein
MQEGGWINWSGYPGISNFGDNERMIAAPLPIRYTLRGSPACPVIAYDRARPKEFFDRPKIAM